MKLSQNHHDLRKFRFNLIPQFSEESSIVVFNALEASLDELDGTPGMRLPRESIKIKDNELGSLSPRCKSNQFSIVSEISDILRSFKLLILF